MSASDRRLVYAAAPPPAVRSRLPLVLWIAAAVFIVYGATIPFNFALNPRVVHEHLARLTWNPLISPDTGRRVSVADFTGNILLFMPFGCFGVWVLRRERSAAAPVALVIALGVLLSAAVETIQLGTVDRTSSVADVFANGIGALIGAVGAVVMSTTLDASLKGAVAAGLADSTALFPLVMAAGVMLAGAWEPFDVTIDVGSIVPKLRTLVHDPLQFSSISDEPLSLLQHALFASALVVWLKDLRVRSAAVIAAITGIVIAVAAEGAQLFIEARMPGLWDAAVGAAGAIAGVPIGIAFARGSRRWIWCGALIAVTTVGVAVEQLTPFTMAMDKGRPFEWMPFLNYYAFTTRETVSHAAELLLAYLPLGFGLAVGLGTRVRVIGITSVALAIAVPVEWLQRYVGGRYPDITDIMMSVAGAWLGAWTATDGWRLFNDEIAVISRSAALDASSPRRAARPHA